MNIKPSRPNRSVLIVALMLGFLPARAGDELRPQVVGEISERGVETPHPVPRAGKDGVAWREELSWPGASYIAVHFERFDLAKGEMVELSSPDGKFSYTFQGEGKLGSKGTFWATYVPGDTCVVTYYGTDGDRGFGYVVDKFAHGFPFFGAEESDKEVSTVDKLTCGPADNAQYAKCYTGPIYDKAKPVIRLLTNGTNLCTGFLFGNQGHLLTNHHCIQDQTAAMNTDYRIMQESPGCTTGCSSVAACPGTVITGTPNVVYAADYLDTTLIQLASNPTGTYGYLSARPTSAVGYEQIYIAGYPVGFFAKRLSVNSDDPADQSNPNPGKCHANAIGGFTCISAPAVQYFCDMQGGNSGSPVIAIRDYQVVAMNECHGCPNQGLAMPAIVADLRSSGVLPACAVGCDLDQVPALVAPADGTSGLGGTPLLDWSDLSWAQSYNVQVATDAAFTSIVGSAIVTSSQWTVSPVLTAGTTYYWRVRDGNTCSACPWSAVRSFSTCAASIPTLLSPSNGAVLATLTTPTLDWNDTAGPYELQVSTSSTFGSILLTQPGLPTSSWTVTPALGTGRYYWRVRSTGTCGNTAWSLVRSFDVGCVATTAAYSSTLRAPACAASACNCSSGGLLTSRDSILGGGEQSQPNTINNSCADGTSGSFHSTSNGESVDGIVIRATDGLQLRPGGPAEVKVTVWCRGTLDKGEKFVPPQPADWVDLYYTSNASSPAWTQIGSSIQCSSGGANTFYRTFNLATGTGTHAIRAQIRYGGGLSTCTSGAYNDRDDLAFWVSPQDTSPAAAGYAHTVLLYQDGTVLTNGSNQNGQLGRSGGDSGMPAATTPFITAIAVAAGVTHSAAVSVQNGSVYTWGGNSDGQIGDGTQNQRNFPYLVPSLSGVAAIATGARHTLALKADGTLWAWGDNAFGQLGDGTTTDRLVPTLVPITNVVAIAAGYYHSAAVRSDGTVLTWGFNNAGQLGDNTHASHSSPAPALNLAHVRRVSCGGYFCLALLQDGTVKGWGHNYLGELGDTTQVERPTAVVVPGLSDITALSAGAGFSLALRSDSTVLSSGQNMFGQLGDDTLVTRLFFAPVQGLVVNGVPKPVTSIAAGEDHSIARWGNLTWGWGRNTNLQIGNSSSPQKLPVIFFSTITGVP